MEFLLFAQRCIKNTAKEIIGPGIGNSFAWKHSMSTDAINEDGNSRQLVYAVTQVGPWMMQKLAFRSAADIAVSAIVCESVQVHIAHGNRH